MDNANTLAEHISDSLSGNSKAVISMNGVYYTIKPPKTKTLALMLKPLSYINVGEFNGEPDIAELLKLSVEQYRYADECIAICILGERVFGMLSKLRLWRLKRKLSLASDAERYDALNKIVSLIIPASFFHYSRLAMEVTGTMTKTKQK